MIRHRAQAPRTPAAGIARAAAATATAAAAAVLVLAGCKPLATASAPVPGDPAAPTQSGPLYTEPAAGFSPVYRLIRHARHYIDLTMYEFSDPRAARDLAAAAQRGVTVKVILDQRCSSARRTSPPHRSNRNRELGLITGSQQVMSSIASTFAADYRNGRHWP